MHKLRTILTLSISIILVVALVLGISGCSTGTTVTSTVAPATTSTVAPASTTVSASTTTVAPTSTITASSTEPIKIGVIGSLSGFFSTFAKYETDSAQMAVDEINAAGGLLGRKIVLDIQDDQGDPSKVIQCATALKSDGCVGIVGTFTSAANSLLIKWCGENKMLLSNGYDGLYTNRTTNWNKYVFFTSPMYRSMGVVLADQVAKQDDVTSVYYLAGNSLAIHEIYDQFWAEMTKIKPSVQNAGSFFNTQTSTDYTNIIAATLSKKPSLVLNLVAGAGYVAFVQQASALGYFNQTKTATAFNMGAGVTVGFGKDYPTGIQAVTYCPFYLDTAEMQAFTNDYYTRTKFYPDEATLAWYVSTLALINAMQQAGTVTDTDKIISTWEQMALDTPLGSISFNTYDHQANTPLYWGISAIDSKYPQAVMTDIVRYQDNIYPTEAEITAARAAGSSTTTPTP